MELPGSGTSIRRVSVKGVLVAAALSLMVASCTSSEPAEPTSTAGTDAPTTTAAPTTTTMPTTTMAPTTTTTLPPTADPDALLGDVNEVMAAQGTFLVVGTIELAENFGDSEEIFSTAFFRGGQDARRNHWIDAEILFEAKLFAGAFEIESREVDEVAYEQDPETGDWEIEEPDGEFRAIDAVLDGEIVLADTTATETDGSYEITGTVPADPSIEIVILSVRASDLRLESVLIRTLKPREEFVGIIGAGDTSVFETEAWTITDYGTEVVEVLAPTEGLSTSTAEFADGLFGIQIPNGWQKASLADLRELGLTDLDASAWMSEDGLIMMILVEDLTELGFGALTLKEYVDITVSFVISEDSVISDRVDTTTVQALQATVLTGTADATDLLPFSRFFYLHDGRIALNISVVAPRVVYADSSDLVAFLVNTMLVNDPPLNPFELPDD